MIYLILYLIVGLIWAAVFWITEYDEPIPLTGIAKFYSVVMATVILVMIWPLLAMAMISRGSERL